MCQGYYRHSEGYTPEWEGMKDFKGRIVHPQTWPEDLDYTAKKVVVIEEKTDYGTGIAKSVADALTAAGVLLPAIFYDKFTDASTGKK